MRLVWNLFVVLGIALLSACAFTNQFYGPSDRFNSIEDAEYESIWFTYKNTWIHPATARFTKL